MIATRARPLLRGPSKLVDAHFACARDPFDAVKNPRGYVHFGTSENHLLWDLVGPRLTGHRPVSAADAHYVELWGTQALRSALAALVSLRGVTVAADDLVVASGGSAVLDMLAHVLFNPGEGVLISVPYYAGFDADLLARAGVQPVPVMCDAAFDSDVSAYAAALQAARASGVVVRGLLIANPHNPTGKVYTAAQLQALVDFAAAEHLEVIVDEIYAHSVHGDASFVSALALSDRAHVVYGLAKDFGLSGLKVGIACSRDAEVIAALRTLTYFSPVSSDTQAVLASAFSDFAWRDSVLAANRVRLRAAASVAVAALGTLQCVLPQGGLFLWFHVNVADFSGERAMYDRILSEARVNVSPGETFHCPVPGWFRLCFAREAAVVRVGIERMRAVISPSSL